MIRLTLIAISTLTMTACATAPRAADPAPPPPSVVQDTCAAEAYQVLVGQRVSEVHTDSLPQPLRVYGRGDAVTMDFRPDRMNILVGDNGVIAEVKCG